MLNRFNNFILGFCLYFGEKYILFFVDSVNYYELL